MWLGSGDNLYATTGDSSFYRHDIGSDEWSQLTDLPGVINFGSWLCFDGDGSPFMLQGNSTAEFWRYDILDDEWEVLEDAPGVIADTGGARACGGSAHASLSRTEAGGVRAPQGPMLRPRPREPRVWGSYLTSVILVRPLPSAPTSLQKYVPEPARSP